MARYDTLRNRKKRDKKLKIYQINNPDASLAEIGKIFGICRQRVYQILQKEHK